MGQNVIGVLLGIDATPSLLKKVVDADEGNDGESLMDEWNMRWGFHSRKRLEWIEDSSLIGFWVACAHGDDKGVRDLSRPLSLRKLEDGRDVLTAMRNWQAFMVWARRRGVEIKKTPTLWIAPTEVA